MILFYRTIMIAKLRIHSPGLSLENVDIVRKSFLKYLSYLLLLFGIYAFSKRVKGNIHKTML